MKVLFLAVVYWWVFAIPLVLGLMLKFMGGITFLVGIYQATLFYISDMWWVFGMLFIITGSFRFMLNGVHFQ